MSITALFFARRREQIGKNRVVLPAAGVTWMADVWVRTVAVAAGHHEHTALDHFVRDGDEVAIFPPITGG